MVPERLKTKIYRPPPSILFTGIICTACFVLFGIASVVSAYCNLGGSFKHPTRDAIVFAAIWSGFSLLGIWLIVFYFRYRLVVSDKEIVQTGIFFTKSVNLAQVTAVKWRIIWRDVVIYSGGTRLRIYGLEDLASGDRREFISSLNRKWDANIQQGWELFSKLLLTDFDRLREPVSWRRLSLGLFLASLGTFAWFYLFVWLVAGDRRYLNMGILLAVLFLICLSLPWTRRELRRTHRSQLNVE